MTDKTWQRIGSVMYAMTSSQMAYIQHLALGFSGGSYREVSSDPPSAVPSKTIEARDVKHRLSRLEDRAEDERARIDGLGKRMSDLERKYNYDVSDGGFASILARLDKIEAMLKPNHAPDKWGNYHG